MSVRFQIKGGSPQGRLGVNFTLHEPLASPVRLAHDPNYADGPIDVIGYAAIIPEIVRGSRS